jgi:hypothetical protein
VVTGGCGKDTSNVSGVHAVYDCSSCDPAPAYAGGDGSETTPYGIATPAQLARLAQQVNNGTDYDGVYFILTQNINLEDCVWTPIGNFSPYIPFRGTFDGNCKTISGLTMDIPNSTGRNYIGLFGNVGSNGTVKNLEVSGNISIVNTDPANDVAAGGITGVVQEGGRIMNCSFSGIITAKSQYTGDSFAGGIAGENRWGEISSCYNNGTISGYYSGGIAGNTNNGARILNCYNTGAITGTIAGGITGQIDFSQDPSSVSFCYNTGNITSISSPSHGAGILGKSNFGDIQNCISLG